MQKTEKTYRSMREPKKRLEEEMKKLVEIK